MLDPTHAHLAQFITAGMTDDDRAAIGELPKGHGILGLLINAPQPLRLPESSIEDGQARAPPTERPG